MGHFFLIEYNKKKYLNKVPLWKAMAGDSRDAKSYNSIRENRWSYTKEHAWYARAGKVRNI